MALLLLLLLISVITIIFLWIRVQHFRNLSLKDELTDLPNYRYLTTYLEKNIRKKKLSIVILDLNNFKVLNSVTIHTGDAVLVEFSAVVKTMLNKKSVMFRYRSGDEFALIFIDSDKNQIINELNSIQRYFNSYSFNCLPAMADYRISFCYGINERADNFENLNDFFAVAEKDLAEAKKSKNLK